MFNRHSKGMNENATAALGCNPGGIDTLSQLLSSSNFDNSHPVDIPIILAPFDFASLNADNVSSVLPE